MRPATRATNPAAMTIVLWNRLLRSSIPRAKEGPTINSAPTIVRISCTTMRRGSRLAPALIAFRLKAQVGGMALDKCLHTIDEQIMYLFR